MVRVQNETIKQAARVKDCRIYLEDFTTLITCRFVLRSQTLNQCCAVKMLLDSGSVCEEKDMRLLKKAALNEQSNG